MDQEGPNLIAVSEMLGIQDRVLFSKYIGVPKSDLGYGEKIKWVHIDALDSRHIFYSTFIFSYYKDIKNIVEIGGGYGNLYRSRNSC